VGVITTTIKRENKERKRETVKGEEEQETTDISKGVESKGEYNSWLGAQRAKI